MAEIQPADMGQLAGLLFDRAAALWYRALRIEVLVVLASAVVAFANPTGQAALLVSLGIVALVVVAYAVRLMAEDKHDTAQTMRRQAALSNGLGWPIEPAQLEEWRRKAGASLVRRAAAEPRPDDYYSSTSEPGARRMAEITLESAFYTRHVDLAARQILIVAVIVVSVVLFVVAYLALSDPGAAAFDAVVAQVTATAVLVFIVLDVVGWILRLTRQNATILQVERDLDRLLARADIEKTDVLRLVSEYDCEMVNSVPVPLDFFRRRHDDIRELWEHRSTDSRRPEG
jgi:hypothetical protein